MRLAVLRSVSVAALMGLAGAASAADKVVYAPPAPWVKPALKGERPKLEAEASFARLSEEDQVRFTRGGIDEFHAHRVQVLTSDGLGAAGLVQEAWDPSTETLTIHHLTIERDGASIDVLANDKFDVLRRETSLENDMLDGRLTAALQIADLRVGDVVDYAYTRSYATPLLAGRNATSNSFADGAVGASRIRAVWDNDAEPKIKVGEALPRALVTQTPSGGELLIEANQTHGFETPDAAPLRYATRGVAQYSQVANWQDVSRLFYPLYDRAATLSTDSPLRAEAARIRQAATTPEAQAAMALKLVEDRVRYVAITMNAQGYTPAAADETWRRRFGDCKGKTAMLLALLRELGIEAQPALVHTEGGDLLSEALPQANSFDHVLVRASIGGRIYWLDGTRSGDGAIGVIPTPEFKWALPLTADEAGLERIEAEPSIRPEFQTVLEVDASGGFDKPSKVKATVLVRGEDALSMARYLPGETRAKGQEVLLKAYADRWSWADFKTATWRWNADEGLMTATLEGEGELSVEVTDGVQHIDFSDSYRLKTAPVVRPADQDQAAPYVQAFPLYQRFVEVVKLPGDGRSIDVFGEPLGETLGGTRQIRTVSKMGNYALMSLSVRRLRGELTAAEAAAAAKAEASADQSHAGLWAAAKPGRRKAEPKLAKLNGPQAWERGMMAEAAGDDAAAEAAYAMALAKGVKEPALALQRGEVLLRLKRFPEVIAVVDGEQRPLVGSELMQAQWLRQSALVELKREDEAHAILTRDIDATPNAWTHILRARVNRARNDEAAAAKDLKTAAGMGSDNAYVIAALVDDWSEMGRWDEAADAAARGVALEPDAYDAWAKLAYAQAESGRKAAALSSYEEMLRILPVSTDAMVGRAELLAGLDRKPEATAQLDAALATSPLSPVLLNAVCWGRATLGLDAAKALEECELGLKLSPNDSVLLDTRGFVKLRLGLSQGALADYEQAILLKPDQIESPYGRGIARIRTGATAAGQADLAAAETLEPGIGKRWAGYGMTP